MTMLFRMVGLLIVAGLALVLLAACRGEEESPVTATATPATTPQDSATPVPTPSPTTTLSNDEAVIASYERYWEVYAEALANLDVSQLEEVMMGARLERAIREVEGLRSRNQAVRVLVELHPEVAVLDADRAVVVDEYTNQSYLIDPQTKEPIAGTGEEQSRRDTFTLLRIDGAWKVAQATREGAE